MKMARNTERDAYHADEPPILHFFNGNIVHQARDDSPRPSLFAKVNLLRNNVLVGAPRQMPTTCLDIKTVCIRVLIDC